MRDLHFDLLTKMYVSYLENDYTFIENFIKSYNKENVNGVIANMCFMSKEEMALEYHPKYYSSEVSVLEMFYTARKLLKKYLPKDIKIIFSIEGCDYVKDIRELDFLYELGLRAIAPVWNEKNDYGSGIRGDSGLTEKGKRFIWHAFEKGIGVDLSHANKKTFDDIIDVARLAQNEGLEPIIFASHSNCYTLCDRDRNLTDEQLLKIKELNGIVGLFSNRGFVLKNSLQNHTDNKVVKDMYLSHIKYLENLFGGIDNIAVSTDDMTFCGDKEPDYYQCPVFSYGTIKQDLTNLLKTEYNDKQVKQILEGNSKKLFRKLRKENRHDRYKTY